MFKGIAPPSQFPATIASGAPPRPNHACFDEGVHACFETLGTRGGGGFATRALRFFQCYITPAFSRVPNKGDKIRIGCLTLAFSGAQKRAEMLHNPCILGGLQQRGQNQSTRKREKKIKNFCSCVSNPASGPADCPHWGLHPFRSAAETLLYPLGYGPSPTDLRTVVILIFGPIWFSSIIGFS